MKHNYLILILFSAFFSTGYSQAAKDSELFLQLKNMDSLFFEAGFNHCEIAAFEAYVSKDLEFYHDQSGISHSREEFLKAVKQNICSSPNKKPIRQLKPESLEVFPLYQNGELYGAIQKGEHDFFIKEPNKELIFTSTAQFTHLWLLEEEKWMLKRVLSYDHKTP